jgi:hypothetical protein
MWSVSNHALFVEEVDGNAGKTKMKPVRNFFIGVVIIGNLVTGLDLLHAQTAVVGNFNSNLSLVQAAAPDSIVQITADAQGLSLVSPGQAPRTGTFWWILPSGTAVPAPCPPQNDLFAPIYQLAAGQFLVDQTGGQIPAIPRRFGMQAQTTGSTAVSGLEMEADTVMSLITRVQMAAASQQMRMMGMNLPMPGDGGGDDSGGTNGSSPYGFHYTPPTNGLWLEITNVSGGLAYLNLHNATDAGGVYEIFSKIDLSAPSWNIETDLWPTDTNCMPFTIPVLDRTNTLFVWARDWTGVDENSNGIPDWWELEHYGDASIYANPQSPMTGTNQHLNLTLSAYYSFDQSIAGSFAYTIIAGPTNGYLTGTGANRTYMPNLNYEGMDHFTFAASDGVWINSATVTIFVAAGPANLTAQPNTNGPGVLLSWGLDDEVQQMINEDGLSIYCYQVYRSATPGGPFVNISTVNAYDPFQANFYWDTAVAPGDTNYYAVTFQYEDESVAPFIDYESPYSNMAAGGLPSLSPIRPGFGQNYLVGNDDGSTGLINLPMSLKFFGTTYSQLFVNNNGNVTFGRSLEHYTPISIVQEAETYQLDIIAPFWADVDTRATGSGLVTYGTNTVNGHAAFGVNWPYVGYYNSHDDKTNLFQLVLIDRPDRASGDYDVEFNYAHINWEAGDVSGGSDGLWIGPGGYPARTGFASSSGSTFEISGSSIPGAFLDSNPTTGLILHTNAYSGNVLGRYVFQFHNGTNSLAYP